MYTFSVLLTASLSALIIGFIAGAVIGLRKSPAKKAEDLEKHLSEMQQQQETYQHEVTEHFTQTAELLDRLTNSYRDVHDHLSRGAQSLAAGDANSKMQALDNTGDVNSIAHQAMQDDVVTPPLDYAPKTDDQIGMLNEEFGLKKNNEDEEPPIAGTAT